MRKNLTFFVFGFLLLVNLALNLAILDSLSKYYSVEFRPEIISQSLRYQIESASKTNMPQVILFKDLDYSYAHSHIRLTGGVIYIYIDLNLQNELNESEMRALIAHEFGHYGLGHLSDELISEKGDVRKEIAADLFAIQFVDSKDLASTIKKLVWNPNEKDARLAAIGEN